MLTLLRGERDHRTLKDSRNIKNMLKTTCLTNNTWATPFSCCDVVGCTCAEAAGTLPSCSAAANSFTPGPCGNGYFCCQTVCDTCCSEEAYQSSVRETAVPPCRASPGALTLPACLLLAVPMYMRVCCSTDVAAAHRRTRTAARRATRRVTARSAGRATAGACSKFPTRPARSCAARAMT